jgi:transcriptional antiterminator NusG
LSEEASNIQEPKAEEESTVVEQEVNVSTADELIEEKSPLDELKVREKFTEPEVQEESSAESRVEEPKVESPKEEPKLEKIKENGKSHLFAIRTTGGQEKIVLNLLQNRVKTKNINIQSVLLIDNLKGYVVIEAVDANEAFNAIQGVRHIRGQLRGELEFKDIEGYLVKKSTVSELAVDKIVEIIGGPFKGMKATITRVDHEKEEATVILLDAPYQLPVTVDANYLKLTTS